MEEKGEEEKKTESQKLRKALLEVQEGGDIRILVAD